MVKFVLCAVFMACLWSTPAFAQLDPDPIVWKIDNIKQEHPYWCWAALAQQVIAKRMGRTLTPRQCDLVNTANEARGLPVNCCENSDGQACGRMAFLSEIMYIIQQYGGKAETIALPESAEELYNIMAGGKAVVVGVQTGENTRHIYLVKAISWQNTSHGKEAILEINDPYYAHSSLVTFSKERPHWVEALAVE